MKLTSSETERDKRLAVAAFLRDSDGQNKERLAHVHSILTGQPLPLKEYTSDTSEKTPQSIAAEKEEKAFWRSFRLRCVFALFLTILIYLAVMTDNPQINPYIKRIQSEIKADYSENLFDFIEQIPYTLEYEKINAEG